METALQILKSGASVNFFLVLIGGSVGLLLKKGIPDRVRDTLMKGMALCVFYIGVSGLICDGVRILVVIASLAVGSVIGEAVDLDLLVNRLGKRIEAVFTHGKGDKGLAEGFVAATLLFCVGAMTVVGSINSGISGDNSTLYSKSVIDCVAAVALASALGAGVLLSALSVLVLEGGLTLLAVAVAPVLTETAVTQMSVIGSLLIVALSFNMLGITKLKVMNFIPAIFLPLIFCLFGR